MPVLDNMKQLSNVLAGKKDIDSLGLSADQKKELEAFMKTPEYKKFKEGFDNINANPHMSPAERAQKSKELAKDTIAVLNKMATEKPALFDAISNDPNGSRQFKCMMSSKGSTDKLEGILSSKIENYIKSEAAGIDKLAGNISKSANGIGALMFLGSFMKALPDIMSGDFSKIGSVLMGGALAGAVVPGVIKKSSIDIAKMFRPESDDFII